MGRKPKIRVSYQNDAGYLVRLAQAIERDDQLDKKHKAELIGLLTSASSLMLKVTSERMAESA